MKKHRVRIESILRSGDKPGTIVHVSVSNLVGILNDIQSGLEGRFEFSIIETNNDNERMYCIFKCEDKLFENIKCVLIEKCGTKFNFNFKCKSVDWRV